MITKTLSGALIALALAASAAHAGMYAGVNYSLVEYDEAGFDSVEPTALVLRLGNELTPNLAVEGRIGFGVSDDSIDVLGTTVDVEVDQFFGVYVRGIAPLGSVALYGLIGYTDGELSAKANGITVSADDSDMSYGVGADFALSKASAINVEWASLLSTSDYDVTALSIGYRHNF